MQESDSPGRPGASIDPGLVVAHTRAWVARAVVGLNLCPFAKAPMVKEQIRYVVSDASHAQALAQALCEQLHALARADPQVLETTLLIHPGVLAEFDAYNDFLDVAEELLEALGYAGELQIASFHPDYRFAGAAPDDIANATNRAPYPILHLLREASIDRAVAAIPDARPIFEANIDTLRRLGAQGWKDLQRACLRDAFGA